MIGGWPIFNHDRRANGVIDFPSHHPAGVSNVAMVQDERQVKPATSAMAGENLGSTPCLDTDLPVPWSGSSKAGKTVHQQPS